MIQAVSGEIRRHNRYAIKADAGRPGRWRTDFIGNRADGKVEDHPQSFLIEMDADSIISRHFHQVDQFQVLVAGGVASAPTRLVALHYVDGYTPNGPLTAGPYGLSILTVRLKCDPGATHIEHEPDLSRLLEFSKRRAYSADNIALSTEPVMHSRVEPVLENVLEQADGDDGLGGYLLRVGGNGKTTGPYPRNTGGQFYLVLNGGLLIADAHYPVWSTVYVGPLEDAFEVRAAPSGVEALVLNFPRTTP